MDIMPYTVTVLDFSANNITIIKKGAFRTAEKCDKCGAPVYVMWTLVNIQGLQHKPREYDRSLYLP